MDILKKMFETSKHQGENCRSQQFPKPQFGDEFRKPVWFDDCESDDELYDGNRMFGAQIFTSPLEMQKHFEQQMQEVMKSLDQFDGTNPPLLDENIRENYMKPGFEDLFDHAGKPDTDLDGEIYADQLHSLLQRISPELEAILPQASPLLGRPGMSNEPAPPSPAVARTEEQQFFDRIHATVEPEPGRTTMVRPKKTVIPARSGIFEGAFQGPKVFRQSVMTQTIRRPDGSTETRRVCKDADGNTNTTITKTTPDGRTEVVTSSNNGRLVGSAGDVAGGGGGGKLAAAGAAPAVAAYAEDRHVYVTKDGYAMPKNIW